MTDMDRLNNLEKMQYSLKKLIKLAKDNSKITAVIPAVLGGFWQLYNLYKIDLAYLRFFSTSQLITDGVIILIILVSISVVLTLYYGVIDFMYGLIKKVENNFKGIKKHLYILSIYYLGILILVGLPISFFYSIRMQRINIYSLLIILVIPIIFIIELYLEDFLIKKKDKNKDKNATKNKKSLVVPIFLIVFFFGILISVYEIFNSEFRFPSNLINTAYIECDIKKHHPLLKNVEYHKIEYYNDKYIFVSIFTWTGRKIKVYDFKDLLKEPDCALLE